MHVNEADVFLPLRICCRMSPNPAIQILSYNAAITFLRSSHFRNLLDYNMILEDNELASTGWHTEALGCRPHSLEFFVRLRPIKFSKYSNNGNKILLASGDGSAGVVIVSTHTNLEPRGPRRRSVAIQWYKILLVPGQRVCWRS